MAPGSELGLQACAQPHAQGSRADARVQAQAVHVDPLQRARGGQHLAVVVPTRVRPLGPRVAGDELGGRDLQHGGAVVPGHIPELEPAVDPGGACRHYRRAVGRHAHGLPRLCKPGARRVAGQALGQRVREGVHLGARGGGLVGGRHIRGGIHTVLEHDLPRHHLGAQLRGGSVREPRVPVVERVVHRLRDGGEVEGARPPRGQRVAAVGPQVRMVEGARVGHVVDGVHGVQAQQRLLGHARHVRHGRGGEPHAARAGRVGAGRARRLLQRPRGVEGTVGGGVVRVAPRPPVHVGLQVHKRRHDGRHKVARPAQRSVQAVRPTRRSACQAIACSPARGCLRAVRLPRHERGHQARHLRVRCVVVHLGAQVARAHQRGRRARRPLHVVRAR
mmetsp:Transcript_41928/g.105743  ORF Transcript_41928/g.105743 Transcript_41928/m.105743 type:complete len:390 (+) Transcript_41928:203-1372(+)